MAVLLTSILLSVLGCAAEDRNKFDLKFNIFNVSFFGYFALGYLVVGGFLLSFLSEFEESYKALRCRVIAYVGLLSASCLARFIFNLVLVKD